MNTTVVCRYCIIRIIRYFLIIRFTFFGFSCSEKISSIKTPKVFQSNCRVDLPEKIKQPYKILKLGYHKIKYLRRVHILLYSCKSSEFSNNYL